MSDKEIKDDTKKASHILIKVKSDSDKEGLSDKKQKQKLKNSKRSWKIQINLMTLPKRINGFCFS